MERRTFLRLSAAAALVGGLIDIDEAVASGCAVVTATDANLLAAPSVASLTSWNQNKLMFWIDGPMNSRLPGYSGGLATRARISIAYDLIESNNHYVESVSLVEKEGSNRTLLQQVHYGPGMGTVTGRQPYTVFENLNLKTASNVTYEVIYVTVRTTPSGQVVEYLKLDITHAEPSRFDYAHIASIAEAGNQFAAFMLDDIRSTNQYYFQGSANPQHSNSALQKSGYVTTPFGATFESVHTARAWVKKIAPRGATDAGDFEIEVDFMHGDAGDAHYMRYFLVLDPVGRVLGGVRRTFGDKAGGPNKVLIRRGFFSPEWGSSDPRATSFAANNPSMAAGTTHKYNHVVGGTTVKYGVLVQAPGITVPDLTSGAGLTEYNNWIGKLSILDCPHVSIYTDDRFHAVARATLRLR